MKLPSFDQLARNYPTDNPEIVKSEIGGEADAGWIINTCILRMSRSFNYAGHKRWRIPANNPGLTAVIGRDNLYYAIRVREFIDFVRDNYGSPDVIRSGELITSEHFSGYTGIIVWRVDGWRDATGHFTLWDGTKGLYEGSHRYFDLPRRRLDGGGGWLTKVELWRC